MFLMRMNTPETAHWMQAPAARRIRAGRACVY